MIIIIFEIKKLIKVKSFMKISNVVNNINIAMIFIIIKTNVINEIDIKNIIVIINKTIINVITNLLKIYLIQLFRYLCLNRRLINLITFFCLLIM